MSFLCLQMVWILINILLKFSRKVSLLLICREYLNTVAKISAVCYQSLTQLIAYTVYSYVVSWYSVAKINILRYFSFQKKSTHLNNGGTHTYLALDNIIWLCANSLHWYAACAVTVVCKVLVIVVESVKPAVSMTVPVGFNWSTEVRSVFLSFSRSQINHL